MKLKPEHFEYMRDTLAGRIPVNATMRQRWDATYAAGLTPWICANIYSYCNDTHIDTALRAISKDAAR